MKKLISILITIFVMLSPICTYAEPNDDVTMADSNLTAPDVSHAQAAILMDMKTGRVLYGKNTQETLFPASTTKIMTGILALENGNLNDTVTATYEAIKDITLEDSHMGILIGEELTFEQLVSGMLIYSANDAANVIAIHLAGSVEKFVEMMNIKAQQLGMNNTHFMNACGIQNDQHYTTAEDLAILSKYCMQNDKFRGIVKTPIYKIPATNKYAKERILTNTNLFLGTSRSQSYYYQQCIGIKTGHTSDAGYCLVSAAEYNNISLLAVVLKCQNLDERQNAYSYIDSKNLFNFGFNNYVSKKISSPGDIISDSKVYEAKDNTRVALTVPEDIYALIPKEADIASDIETKVELPSEFNAPIAKGETFGRVIYTCNGNNLASTNLVAANEVEQDKILLVIHTIIKVISNPFCFIPVILLILIIIISNNQRKKRNRKRRINQLKRNKQNNTSDASYRAPDRNASRTEIREAESKGSNSRYRNK